MHVFCFSVRSLIAVSILSTFGVGLSLTNAQVVAHPTAVSFNSPTVSLGTTSDPSTITIDPFNANYTLVVAGPNQDQFTATAVGNPATPATPVCSDRQIKTSQCMISLIGANTPPIALTVSFRPTSTAPQEAYVYAVSATGDPVKLSTLSGTGLYELPNAAAKSGCSDAFSDCDLDAGLGFSLLGGLEQSYLTSQDNQTNGFIRAYANVGVPLSNFWTGSIWAAIRDLGTPSANSNQNLVAAIGNPDGTITSTSLASIGYSIDFLVGLGLDHPIKKTIGQYSFGPIVALGATTPLGSTSANVGYVVPALGTQECSELQMRFTGTTAYHQGYTTALVAGTAAGPSDGNTKCLYNTSGGLTPTAVSTLAFTGANRSSFLEKWEIGIRTSYRSYTSAGQASCDTSHACQRGTVDFTIGQDAAITGGLLRKFVVKVDGIQPFPYSGGYLYIFGSAALRFEKNISYSPLILMAASSTALQTIPTPSVVVEPLQQPNKDFYRIGVGISLDKVLTKLKAPSN